MYPEYARDTVTEWVVGHRESDFALDLDHAHDLVKERQPSVVLLPSPNNPTGRPCRSRAVTASVQRRRTATSSPGSSWSTRRTASSAAPGPRAPLELLARHRNLVVTRTMSKCVCAGRRPVATSRSPPRSARRDPGGAAAVPPLRGHARRRRSRRSGTRPSCSATVDELRSERTARWPGSGVSSPSPTATRTSRCSGRSSDRRAVLAGLLDRGVLIRETGPDEWLSPDRHGGRDAGVPGSTDPGPGSTDGSTDGSTWLNRMAQTRMAQQMEDGR